MVDEPTAATSPQAPRDERPPQDPIAALLRARRRKRRAWFLGLAATVTAGTAWAVIAQWPPPTSHVRLELDVTCPMEVGGAVADASGPDHNLPRFLAGPLPDDPGQTVAFEVDTSPGAYASVHAQVPDGLHLDDSRCQRAACRIYADGALVFEGLTTAGRWLSCAATLDRRSPSPAISHPFANTLTIRAPAR